MAITQPDDDAPLVYSDAATVGEVQAILGAKGIYTGDHDGRWGPLTAAAVKAIAHPADTAAARWGYVTDDILAQLGVRPMAAPTILILGQVKELRAANQQQHPFAASLLGGLSWKSGLVLLGLGALAWYAFGDQ